MLNKNISSINQASQLSSNQAIVISVSTDSELQAAVKILETKTSLKGIQLPSSLITQIPEKKSINFFSIILKGNEHKEHLKQIITYCQPKQQFIELIIPYQFFSEQLITNLQGVKRVIVDFTESNLSNSIPSKIADNQINNIFAILISSKFFPFTLGLNEDVVQPRHMVEFYNETLKDAKDPSAAKFLETKEEGTLL
jgi:hypothetical protein